jgi:hypothetical protein
MEITKKYIIDRKHIGFFRWILESYEDIGIFSVIDGNRGIIEVIYSAFFENDMNALIKDMENYGIVFRPWEPLDIDEGCLMKGANNV